MSFSEIKSILNSKTDAANRWGREMMTLAALGKSSSSDYLFEFYFFLTLTRELVTQLGGSWQVEVPKASNPSSDKYVWPLKPGQPDNFSYVSGSVNGNALEIRPGVEANVPGHSTTISPDVSIRVPSAIDSRDNSVVRIWDAKYRSDPKDRITRPESFAFMFEVNCLINAIEEAKFDANFGVNLKKAPHRGELLTHSSLATNGRHSESPKTLLQRNRVGETEQFGVKGAESYRGA